MGRILHLNQVMHTLEELLRVAKERERDAQAATSEARDNHQKYMANGASHCLACPTRQKTESRESDSYRALLQARDFENRCWLECEHIERVIQLVKLWRTSPTTVSVTDAQLACADCDARDTQ